MNEILNEFFLLNVNNRLSITLLVVIMASILLSIFILTIIKNQKSK